MNHAHPIPAQASSTSAPGDRAVSRARRFSGLAALLLAALLPAHGAIAQSTANYGFVTATNASLTDMSSGTTQLVAASADDTASVVVPIGFDFFFLGTRYTQFSASSNGFLRLGGTAITGSTYALGATGAPLITSLGSDLVVSPTGRVHYKVEGTAPNRVLVVEFLNMHIIYSEAPSADGTSQIRLHESTGVIELVYGGMVRNASQGFQNGLDAQHIGFSLGSAAGSLATIDTANGVVATALTPNQFPLDQPMASLNSANQGERRVYAFIPSVPAAPTNLSFSAVSPVGMSLNWDDASNELSYAVHRSTDGVNFSHVATVAANTTTFAASALQPSTTYFWRVFAVSEGALSPALAGSQATAAPGSDVCAATGGNWDDTATWADGSVPTTGDNVIIGAGCTVTVNVATATALNVTIEANGVLQSPSTGTSTTNTLTVTGNVVNNGTLDFSTNANTSGARLNFGPSGNDSSFSGSGGVADLRELAVDKGNRATVVTVAADNLTVRGLASGAPGFLVLTSGTARVAGSFTLSSTLFPTAGYSIPAAAGLWLDNPNFTVAAQAGSPTNNGQLRLTQGTYNVGTAAGNSMGGGTGAGFRIEGGTLNIAGRLQTTNVVQYVQTGGTVNLATVGNTASTAAFGLTATGNIFDFAGGSIVLVQPSGNATPLDYSVSTAATFVTNPAQTTLQLGAAASPAAAVYRVTGATPSLAVTAGRTMFVGSGTAAGIIGADIFFRGASLVNDGAIRVQGINSRFDFNANGPMTYSGSGSFGTPATPFAGVGVSSNSMFPTTLLAPIYVNRVNLLTGGFINSGQITLGNAGTSTTVVQVGLSGLTVPGGSFDVSPVHNQGSGGQIVIYSNESVARTTGPEINPTRTLAQLTVDNANGVQLSGGDLALTSAATALTLTNGRLITGPAVVALTQAAAAVVRTNGYVDGNLRKPVAAAGVRSFEVGTANGYSPVSFNVTAGTFPSSITASAVQGVAPGFTPASLAIARHWNLTATDITADVTFSYRDPADLGAVNEAQLRAFRQNGPAFSDVGGTVDAVANTVTVSGVSTFSVWTLAEPAVGALSISPDLRDFGNIPINTTSPALTVTLQNTGTAALSITGIAAPTGPFARVDGSCGATPIELAPDASCTLAYTFAPTATDTFENTLEVTASVPGGSIVLRGIGIAAGNLTISPASVDFGSVLVGTASDVRTVALGNSGTASLQITGITLADVPFVRTADGSCGNSLPITIAVGASCTLSYRFEPAVGGSASQSFTVTANASGDSSFELLGVGTLPPAIFADGFEELP
jgi:hypothetical protein